jgi:hypothetical protein
MITVAIAAAAVDIVISVSIIRALAEAPVVPPRRRPHHWKRAGAAAGLQGIWTDETDTRYAARQKRPFNPSARR